MRRADAERLAQLSRRLDGARSRTLADARRSVVDRRAALEALDRRLRQTAPRLTAERRTALDRLDRLRQTLGHAETLRRGFAVVRGAEGDVITSAAAAAPAPRLVVEFHDGSVAVRPETAPGRKRADKDGGQKSLF